MFLEDMLIEQFEKMKDFQSQMPSRDQLTGVLQKINIIIYDEWEKFKSTSPDLSDSICIGHYKRLNRTWNKAIETVGFNDHSLSYFHKNGLKIWMIEIMNIKMDIVAMIPDEK